MVYRLVIDGWRPTLASELKCHPLVAARKKKADARAVLSAAVLQGVPAVAVPPHEAKLRRKLGLPPALPNDPTHRRRRVRFTITGRYSRFPDPDAPLKSGLDALVTAGLLVDDDAAWCDWDKPRFERGPKGTVIELTDID